MSKKARTILFFILAVIFLIITPMILFYSEGYRVDFKTGKIIETGGLYIKTNPGEATVLINDKKEEKTSGFSKSLFIQNFLPKTYNIKISKEGYLPWEKNIEIVEKKVSEIDIILFKETYIKTLINSNLLSLNQVKNSFLIQKEEGFFYYNPENNKEELITDSNDWNDFQIIENNLLLENGKKYFLFDNDSIEEIENLNQINFKKDHLNNLYYQIDKTLYKNKEVIKTNIDFYEINNNTLYYFKDGSLYRDDAKLSNLKFEISDKNYSLLFIYNKIFLNENNENLFILENNEFKKILSLNNYFECSEWDGKILFNTGNEIWAYFSKETYYPEFTKENTLKLIARFQNSIKDLSFINDKYYLFVKDNELLISEFDYRDKINIFTIANNLENPKVFFNYDNKNIYIFEENSLYLISKIIP